MVYPIPNQQTGHLVRLFAEQIVSVVSVAEIFCLTGVQTCYCKLLGTKKLNTTAYLPECDGREERFNRTLKTMIRKHVDEFGVPWDKNLPRLL